MSKREKILCTICICLVVLLISICLLSNYILSKNPDMKYNNNNTNDNNYYEFDIKISTQEMSEVYFNNELDGNKRFFGKKVKTKARFDEVSNGIFSGMIAYFYGIDSIYNIHCTSFDKKSKENLSKLNYYETVNIIGTVGELVGSSITFKDCKIYK